MSEADKLKIILTGGGSGGHTMPAAAMISTLKKYFSDHNMLDLLYIGSKEGIEKNIIESYDVRYTSISTGKLRRYFSIKNFTDIINILTGFFESLMIIKNFNPDILFSTGGFVSVPPVIAAKIKKIPIIIHEQTIDAGLANKIAGHFATIIALTFKDSLKYFDKKKCIHTGIPLRDGIFNGDRDKTIKKFNLDKNLPVVYFTGGGLGCHILNITAGDIIPDLLAGCNIIFQTGNALNGEDYRNMKKLREKLSENKKKRFIVKDFIKDEINDVFAVTDLAIGRSGAGTVNEFMALNIPAIYIPLAIATNSEQYKNALFQVNLNGAVIIEEKNLTSKMLYETITNIIFTDKAKIMKKNLKKANFKKGNEKILELIIKYRKH